MNRLIIIAVTIVSIFAGDRVAAQEAIGTVSRILGEANATRGGDTRALSINTSVILNETVSTGTAGQRGGWAAGRLGGWAAGRLGGWRSPSKTTRG